MITGTAMNRRMLPVIVLTLATLTACGRPLDDVEPETTTFKTSADELKIDFDDGDINVTTGDVDEIEVTRWFTGDPGEAAWTLDSDQLALTKDCGFLSGSCQVRYQVTVPEGIALELNGTSGDVDIAGFAEPLTIRTANGKQSAVDLTSPEVETSADNGSIDLAFAEPPASLDIMTENGSVNAELPDIGYVLDIRTDNGGVSNDLREDDGSDSRINIRTDNGEVSLTTPN